jgi:hypothetical protein
LRFFTSLELAPQLVVRLRVGQGDRCLARQGFGRLQVVIPERGTVYGGLDAPTAALVCRTLSAYTLGSLIEDRRTSPLTTGDRDAEFEFGLDAILAGLREVTAPTRR